MASETELREKLATCVRILNMQGLMGLFGHVSAYEPERGRVYFSPTRGADKAVVRPDDLVVSDLEGNVLDGKGTVPKEYPIHTAVHAARPDLLAVAHLHPFYSTLFAVARCVYRPITLQGCVFGPGVPVFNEPHLITTPALDSGWTEQPTVHGFLGETVSAKYGFARVFRHRPNCHGIVICC